MIELLKGCRAAIVIGEPLTRRVIDSSSELRIIAKVGVGYDNIDVKEATERGVFVALTPVPEQAKAMAEYTFALMLSLAKKVPSGNQEIRSGRWGAPTAAGEVEDLYDKTLGLLGVGRIGAEVAKRAKAFEMPTLYYDLVRRTDLEETLGIVYVPFEELLSRSDILSIHVPLTSQTTNWLDGDAMARMKKGALLINTARGAIVDEKALARALNEHTLGGASLDALTQEPPEPGHVFYMLGDRLPNLILTPHMGFSKKVVSAMATAAADQVVETLGGARPKYVLNPEVK